MPTSGLRVACRAVRSPPVQLALASLLIAVACLPLAFFAMFTGFNGYDDEGYVLISLRHYVAGGALYDQVYSHYGPAFYELIGSAVPLLGLEITHAGGRAFTAGVWLATSVLCGVASYRLSRNVPVALCAQLLVFLSLESLRNEPMHPGGLLCLLLGGVVLTGSYLGTRARPAVAAGIGALVALIALTKINVGLFALVAVVFALTAAQPPTGRWRIVQWLAAAAMLAVAPALTRDRHDDPEVWRYASVVVLAAFSVVLTELTPRPRPTGARMNLVGLSIGCAIVGALVCLRQVVRGTSVMALVHGVLLDPWRMPASFSLPLGLPDTALPFAVLSALACVLVALVRRRWLPGIGAIAALRAPAQLAAGLLIWLFASGTVSPHPFTAALPLLWVALAPPCAGEGLEARRTGKSLLLALAVLQTLHAYPVAGSQQAWASFLFIPIGAVGIAEGWRGIAVPLRRLTGARAPALAAAATVGVVALTTAGGTLLYRHSAFMATAYDAWVPLALPGTERIRVPDSTARLLHWLTETLSARCRSFISLPGLDSLYLFTRSEPPTMFNTNNWMTMFDAPRQALIRDAFVRMPGPRCVIRSQEAIDLWSRKRRIPEGPLMRYIDDFFVTAETYEQYELMRQRPEDPHEARSAE